MVNSCTRQSARWDTEAVAEASRRESEQPSPGGRCAGAGRGGARRAGTQVARRAEIDADLTRYEYNVDIATYVRGLDTRCIL